ncbi:MAG: hypothetical protein DRI34_12350 [Deltaproteobacteria bacterium]|nr:MAG: hypothetical protein DRI34_12350 [Deltaproteobacteria bacterium]
MFLPLGDTPNPRNFTPWVNWALIAANVGVYVLITLPLSQTPVDPTDPLLREYLRAIAPNLPPLTSLRQVLVHLSAYDLFTFAHGYKPGAPEVGDLFACMFLHGGFLHLAGNMLFLWIFGDNVEHRLGRVGYLLAYLATGVLATLSFSLFETGSMTPLVGASGAISGVLGFYFLQFPRNKVKVFVLLFPFFFDVLLLPVRWVLGFFVIFDNLIPFLFAQHGGVAYGAHLGGFLGGLALAWVGESFGWHLPWRDRHWRLGRRRSRRRAEQALERIRRAVASGDRRGALQEVAGLGRDDINSLPPGECALLAQWLDEAGHPVAGSNLLRRCLAAHSGSSDLAKVYLELGLLRLRQGQPTAAYQHLLSVFDYDPDPETAARARQALAAIDVYRGKSRVQ